MSLDLLYERIRTHIAPYGISFEHIIVNADSNTSYVGFVRAGGRTSEARWIIFRIKQSSTTVTTRMARTSATVNDQEQLNKVWDNYATYDYVD